MRIPPNHWIPQGESVSRRSLLFSLISAFPAGGLLRGQKDTTFSSDVKVVNVLATVRNKQGEIVHNLNKEDFVLMEDGRPQTGPLFLAGNRPSPDAGPAGGHQHEPAACIGRGTKRQLQLPR